MAERDERVDGARDYDGLSAGEVWMRVCEQTGIQHTTTKLGSEFDWCDFAALAEATIGLALHERALAARELARLRAPVDPPEDIRLACFSCGKSVSTPVPATTVVRASLECPECLESAASGEREGVLNGPATQATVTTGSPGVVDPPDSNVMLLDMVALMEALGISTHARNASPHEVMRDEIIPAVRALVAPPERVSEKDSYHGCFTGDCPHDSVHECLEELRGYVGGLERVSEASALRDQAKGACGLFHVPLADAREIMPDLPWDEAPVREGVEYVADVKVHMLMPGQWPCIPNWHQDFVPRDPETLEERPDLLGPDNPPMLLWLSGPPLTEFRDEGISAVPARTWVEFTQFDEHRGVAATEHGWRTFIRLTPVEVMREGLPHEQVPAPPEKWIRRHTQVYLDAENFKW